MSIWDFTYMDLHDASKTEAQIEVEHLKSKVTRLELELRETQDRLRSIEDMLQRKGIK